MASLSGLLGFVLLVGTVSGPAVPGRAEEAAVLEAALQQQIGVFLDETARAQRTVLCFGIDPGDAPQSPSREFLSRFKEPAVRSLGECESSPKGARERSTRSPAVLVTAGPVEWVAGDEAWVTVSHFRTKLHSGVRTYRVVKERTGWVSLGQILRDGPA